MHRLRLTYSNVMATFAVFVALGGTSYAAITITGSSVRDGSLTGKDLRDGSVQARDLAPALRGGGKGGANGAAGERGAAGAAGATGAAGERGATGAAGPQGAPGTPGVDGAAGAKGEKGDAGARGEKGDTGTVDTSAFYDKAAADDRFLPKGATAADSAKVGGVAADQLARGKAEVVRIASDVTSFTRVASIGAYDLYVTCSGAATTHSIAIDNYFQRQTDMTVHDGVRAPETQRGLFKTFASDGAVRVWSIVADSTEGTLDVRLAVQPREGGGCRAQGTAVLAR